MAGAKKMPALSIRETADKIRSRDREAFALAAAEGIDFFTAWLRLADRDEPRAKAPPIARRPQQLEML
jgi:hypothetical protein